METYEEILARMEDAYEQESGHKARDVSDTGLRLKVLAGELYRLRAELNWLSLQAFPQTAAGEYLDRHGTMRGVERKEATHAVGTLTFSRYLPLSFDVVIPRGTVCAIPGEEPVEYETLREVVLSAGELTVDAEAQAVLGGSAGNAAAGYVNALTSAPTGVDYVTNKTAFAGGRDRETDQEYRPRVLSAYASMPNGSNAAYYRDIALSFPGVTAAGVKPRANGDNTVAVYVWGKDAAPDDQTLADLEAEMEGRREIGVTVTVQPAAVRAVNIGLRVRLRTGADFACAQADIEAALGTFFAGLSVGSPVYVADLERAVLAAASVTKLEFSSGVQDIAGEVSILPVLGSVSVEALS